MDEHTTTTLLAWPWAGPDDLPDVVRDELASRGFREDDGPGDTLVPDGATVLHGSEATGLILAICDTAPGEGTGALAELITGLADGGLTVYAASDAGGPPEAHCEVHVPDGKGDAVVDRRRVSAGEIVVGASDLVGDAPCLDDITDAEIAGRVRRLLAHPDGLPDAVLAFTAERGDRSARPPAEAGEIDYALLNAAARVLHDAAQAAGYRSGEADGSRWAAARHADTALFVVDELMELAARASDDAGQRPLLRLARKVLGQTPQIAAQDTRSALRLLKQAIPQRDAMADPASLRAVAEAARRGRTVLREISPGIGPLSH
jgi:hypothetical protein